MSQISPHYSSRATKIDMCIGLVVIPLVLTAGAIISYLTRF